MDRVSPIPSAAFLMRQTLWPAAMALAAFIAFAVLLISSADGQPGEAGLLVFPPTWDHQKVMDATLSIDAPLIDIGPAAFVVSVYLEDRATISRAHKAGALLVLNARIAALCGTKKVSSW